MRKKNETCDSVQSSQNSTSDLDCQQQKIVPITMTAQRMELEKQQVLCELEENISDSICLEISPTFQLLPFFQKI